MSRTIDGKEKKKNYSITLEPWVADKIKDEFKHNLSLGITLIVKDWIIEKEKKDTGGNKKN